MLEHEEMAQSAWNTISTFRASMIGPMHKHRNTLNNSILIVYWQLWISSVFDFKLLPLANCRKRSLQPCKFCWNTNGIAAMSWNITHKRYSFNALLASAGRYTLISSNFLSWSTSTLLIYGLYLLAMVGILPLNTFY